MPFVQARLMDRNVDDLKCLIQQHAEDVVNFSSQYGSVDSISYTARNLTGPSRVFPAYGDYAEAYSMRTYGKWWDEAPSGRKEICGQSFDKIKGQDFVDLSFEHKVYPKRITLYEVYNPGALIRIWAKDTNGKWHLMYEAQHLENPIHESREFSPPLNECNEQTSFLRLEFNHERLESYYEVESVLLEGYTRRFRPPAPSPLTVTHIGELTKRVLDLDLNSLLYSSDSSTSSSCSSPIKSEPEEEYELNNFDCLPYEVVLKIFNYLDLKTLCRCSSVSKRFESISKDSSLYMELNLKNDWSIVSEAALQSLATRCNRLTALDMSWCTGKKDFEMPFVKFISKCGSFLKILRLDSCKFISKHCLTEISSTCTLLEELSMRKILQPYQSLVGWEVLAELINLKYLDLYHVPINTNELMSFLPSLAKLEHLNLGSCAASRLTLLNMDVVAECLSKYNRDLVSIDMWRSHLSLTSIGIRCLAKCSRLQELDLGWVEIEALGDCVQELAKGCPQLKKFFVPAMRGLTDRDIHTLITNCPLLEQVDLLGIRNITPEACLRLLTQCRNLRLLDVSYCDKISRAYVALWRAQFPHVSIKQCTYSRPDAIDNFM